MDCFKPPSSILKLWATDELFTTRNLGNELQMAFLLYLKTREHIWCQDSEDLFFLSFIFYYR